METCHLCAASKKTKSWCARKRPRPQVTAVVYLYILYNGWLFKHRIYIRGTLYYCIIPYILGSGYVCFFIITLPHPHKSLFLLFVYIEPIVYQSCAHNIMHRHIIILLWRIRDIRRRCSLTCLYALYYADIIFFSLHSIVIAIGITWS